MKLGRVGPTVCDTALCLQGRGSGAAEGVLFSTAGQSWQILTHSPGKLGGRNIEVMAFDRRSGIPYSGDGRSDGRVDRCAGWLFFFFFLSREKNLQNLLSDHLINLVPAFSHVGQLNGRHGHSTRAAEVSPW